MTLYARRGLCSLLKGPLSGRREARAMATLFTKIIQGEIPGRFVYRDDKCVAFLSIHPLSPGHTLVVPIEEVDHWLDLKPDLLAHLTKVAQKIGAAQQQVFNPVKVGLVIAGLEVPHVHIHLVPIQQEADLDFKNADTQAKAEDLDEACRRLSARLGATV